MLEFTIYHWNIKEICNYLLDNNIRFQIWGYTGLVNLRITHDRPDDVQIRKIRELNPYAK